MQVIKRRYKIQYGIEINYTPKNKWIISSISLDNNHKNFIKHFGACQVKFKNKTELINALTNYTTKYNINKNTPDIKIEIIHHSSVYLYKGQTIKYVPGVKKWYYLKKGKPIISKTRKVLIQQIDKEIKT